jgi:hypothetical protein
LFANRYGIRKLEVDTKILTPVFGYLRGARYVDYDYNDKVVYWSDANRTMK